MIFSVVIKRRKYILIKSIIFPFPIYVMSNFLYHWIYVKSSRVLLHDFSGAPIHINERCIEPNEKKNLCCQKEKGGFGFCMIYDFSLILLTNNYGVWYGSHILFSQEYCVESIIDKVCLCIQLLLIVLLMFGQVYQ